MQRLVGIRDRLVEQQSVGLLVDGNLDRRA